MVDSSVVEHLCDSSQSCMGDSDNSVFNLGYYHV